MPHEGPWHAAQDRLIDLLLEFDDFRDPDYRGVVITELERGLGYRLSLKRYDKPWFDVRELVSACMEHPGALPLLVEVVEKVNGESYAVVALRRLVEEIKADSVLTPKERRNLHGILSRTRIRGATSMFRDAAPLAPLPDRPLDLSDAARHLEDLSAPPGGADPLVAFVQALVRRVEDQVAAMLNDWTAAVAGHMDVDEQTLQRLRVTPRAEAAGAECVYLLLELKPDAIHAQRYLVSAWLQHDTRDLVPLDREDVPRDLEEIRAQLDEWLRRILDLGGPELGAVVVEFILPRHLLSHEVDQWLVGAWLGESDPVGMLHQVVVRSRERVRDRTLHGQWRRKWRWLQANGHRSGPREAVHWVDASGQTSTRALHATLSLDETPACLVLAFPPDADQDLGAVQGLGRDEIASGIKAGTPVILWCRDRRDPARFRAEIGDLLTDGSLTALPERTLRLRKRARAEETPDHLGLHLTLLWDDPDRVPPPEPQLRAPA